MERESEPEKDEWKLSVEEVMEKACTINGN